MLTSGNGKEFRTLDRIRFINFAARLNRLRVERGWTLAELSKLAGLSKPYLSRLESGQRQPSLAALLALARTYNTPLQSLLDTGTQAGASPVVIQGNRAQIQRGNGLRYRAISGGGALVNLSAVHVTVPRRRRQTALARHDGEELLYVLSGTLNLVFEHESHVLSPGMPPISTPGCRIGSARPARATWKC